MKPGYSLEIDREVNDDGRTIKKGKCFLSRNFKFTGRGKSDLVILLSHSSCYCPIVTGEAKTELLYENLHDYFYQLLVYQLALQRPCVLEKNSSMLLGFLIDYTDAYIIELTCGLWTDLSLVTCQKQVERYRVDTDKARLAFLKILVDRLVAKLETVDLERLTKPQSPTFRFPDGVGTLLGNFTHILKLNGAEMNILISNLDHDLLKFHVGTIDQIRNLETGAQLLLKVGGQLISGGMNQIPDLKKLINGASGKLSYLKNHYIAIFNIFERHPFVFSIMYYIDGVDCSKPVVDYWWNENRSVARDSFYTNVYEVAMEALQNGFFHWDIRDCNIVFHSNDTNQPFVVIDWESVVSIEDKDADNYLDIASKELRDYWKQEMHIAISRSALAGLALCERLTVCVSKWESNISSKWFLEQLKLEDEKTKLTSYLNLQSLKPLLDTLMNRALSRDTRVSLYLHSGAYSSILLLIVLANIINRVFTECFFNLLSTLNSTNLNS